MYFKWGGGGIKAFRRERSSPLTKSVCFGNNTIVLIVLASTQSLTLVQTVKYTRVRAAFNHHLVKQRSHLPLAGGCQIAELTALSFSLSLDVSFSVCLHFETEQPWVSSSGSLASSFRTSILFDLAGFLSLPRASAVPLVR